MSISAIPQLDARDPFDALLMEEQIPKIDDKHLMYEPDW